MKVLGPTLLLLEAIVVGLAIPVALAVYDEGPRAAWVLGVLAVLLVLGAGYARRPRGAEVGSVLQLLVLLSGVVVPGLFVLGLLFLGVWILAIVYTGKAERLAAERAAGEPPAAG